jgi:hypothetical protein
VAKPTALVGYPRRAEVGIAAGKMLALVELRISL